MSRDGPTTVRFGYGYRDAVEAGAPYVRPSSEAEANLMAFLSRRPELRTRVSEMRQNGCRSAAAILDQLRQEGLEGRFAVWLWRDPERKKLARKLYADDRDQLEREAEWGFTQRIYKSAALFEFDDEWSEWNEVRGWPESDDFEDN